MNFAALAVAADGKGFDLIEIRPCGSGSELRLIRRQSDGQTDAILSLRTPFEVLERKALAELEEAGWDARFTTRGVKAYKPIPCTFQCERETTRRQRTGGATSATEFNRTPRESREEDWPKAWRRKPRYSWRAA